MYIHFHVYLFLDTKIPNEPNMHISELTFSSVYVLITLWPVC